ncbi:MAG: lytic transglycosylase domain-containing protein, partial [Myxococcota bacterium]
CSPFDLPAKIYALGRLVNHEFGHLLTPDPDVEATIRQHAEQKGLPPELVLAIARRESGLSKRRVSHTGAMGVMQLMPTTARGLGVEDPFSVEESVDGATRLLARHWRRYRGDLCRVAAAYNAGPGRVPRKGKAAALPGETRHYLMHVIGPSCRRLYL